MKRISDIFSTWPTDAALARDIGVAYSTVAAWKQRGAIPVGYWREVIGAAQRRGHSEITATLLADLHAHEPKAVRSEFAEDDRPFATQAEPAEANADAGANIRGHFGRFRHLRRAHFASLEQVNAHVGALRDEWERR